MPKVCFLPSGQSIDVPPGTELLDAALKAGVDIISPCGTKGTCGKCIVKLISGASDTTGSELLSKEAVKEGYIHACKTVIRDKSLTIEIPQQTSKQSQFAPSEHDLSKIKTELLPREWEMHPMVKSATLVVDEPSVEDGLSDLDRFSQSLRNKFDQNIKIPLDTITQLAVSLRQDSGKVTAVVFCNKEESCLIDLKPGHDTPDQYGLAIDLGTTSVSVQLISLPSGKILKTVTDYNQQISCGVDVIGRINYARKADRLQELRERGLKSINELIQKLIGEFQTDQQQICSAVVSGNTTMTHLLLGLDPEFIRLEPYTPTVLGLPTQKAEEIGLEIHPRAPVHISPAVGSYVGGDITAGLLCTDLASDSEEINLFLDIGTNGELVLGNNEFIMTCACSAGPAFEGGGIGCGMRAAGGAIESVKIDTDTGIPFLKTILDQKPIGICGSGIISLLASLFSSGWIDSAGKFDRTRSNPRIRVEGRQAFYLLASCEDSGSGKPLSISEAEIENIIRAKAAIYSACTLMLNQLDINFDLISSFYIAGGFGHFLNLEDCITIGLLPDIDRGKFKFIGNSSLSGSYMLLISKEYQKKQKDLSNRMTYIDLSTDPGYMDQYTAALFLPHTDHSLFPLKGFSNF